MFNFPHVNVGCRHACSYIATSHQPSQFLLLTIMSSHLDDTLISQDNNVGSVPVFPWKIVVKEFLTCKTTQDAARHGQRSFYLFRSTRDTCYRPRPFFYSRLIERRVSILLLPAPPQTVTCTEMGRSINSPAELTKSTSVPPTY